MKENLFCEIAFSCSDIKNKRGIVVLHRLQMVTHRTKYISTQQKIDRNSLSPWLTKYFYVKSSLCLIYRHTKFESCTRNGLVVESKHFPILYIWLFSFEAIFFAFNWRPVLFTAVYHIFLIIAVDFIIYPWLSPFHHDFKKTCIFLEEAYVSQSIYWS